MSAARRQQCQKGESGQPFSHAHEERSRFEFRAGRAPGPASRAPTFIPDRHRRNYRHNLHPGARSLTTPRRRMERSLRNRLTFGPLMLTALFGLLFLDAWFQQFSLHRGWVAHDAGHVWGVGGVGLLILLMIILPPAVAALATRFAAEPVRPY